MDIRTKSAEQLAIGDEILINLNGVMCDVVVDDITLVAPQVEIRHHTRYLSDAFTKTTRLPRYHSVRLIDGE